ncbi:MAG: DUF2809 domain-containing protein [Bryobacterales bacterium]|nr:DUF2809 domain-containing protein [Bryobacterales bacterium]
MARTVDDRRFWWKLLTGVIVSGLLSRTVATGSVWIDKYLGDALYAAMVYVLLRLTGRIDRVAMWSAVVMTAIELFQLTGIPAAMVRSEYLVMRLCGRALGTQFSAWDLLAYAVGIVCAAACGRRYRARVRQITLDPRRVRARQTQFRRW